MAGCLLNRLFRRRSKKISKLRVTDLCVWNSPVTGEFPAQMASNAENVSTWWRHHEVGHTEVMVLGNSSMLFGSLQLSLLSAWKSRWINIHIAGELRRHDVHMMQQLWSTAFLSLWFDLLSATGDEIPFINIMLTLSEIIPCQFHCFYCK